MTTFMPYTVIRGGGRKINRSMPYTVITCREGGGERNRWTNQLNSKAQYYFEIHDNKNDNIQTLRCHIVIEHITIALSRKSLKRNGKMCP